MELEQLSDEGRQIMEAFLNFNKLGRPLAAPPGLDEALATCLRDAVERAATDEDLIAAAQERNRPIGFLPGEELEQVVDDLINNAPEQYLEILKQSMTGE